MAEILQTMYFAWYNINAGLLSMPLRYFISISEDELAAVYLLLILILFILNPGEILRGWVDDRIVTGSHELYWTPALQNRFLKPT